jgi:hypothetical protein
VTPQASLEGAQDQPVYVCHLHQIVDEAFLVQAEQVYQVGIVDDGFAVEENEE